MNINMHEKNNKLTKTRSIYINKIIHELYFFKYIYIFKDFSIELSYWIAKNYFFKKNKLYIYIKKMISFP